MADHPGESVWAGDGVARPSRTAEQVAPRTAAGAAPGRRLILTRLDGGVAGAERGRTARVGVPG
ncbi:hypothetical protein [Gandjariella thermophila]|uniref:Uncharacterized protein n=1 Tax=Gandjariella thermophila TaxID=1931992 RepID=A0A4D4JB00_9PSEU|nr:hypothetical protein [Gandjariella thermophila]GDY31137.1 hypothetical protein GTS_27700 [Gandjariella thermophila]